MLYKNAYKKLCSLSAILLLVLFLSADFYAAPGDLDPTFGNGGKVITDFGSGESAGAVVLQPDGKLIVAGTTNAPTRDFLIVRYNGNGSLDTSFGNGGKVTTDFGAGESAAAVVLQPDGKIVAAGGRSGQNLAIALARYNADGSLDSTFGNGGKVTVVSVSASALVLQADGKLVTAGFAFGVGGANFALIRYNTNGSIDSTFGNNGGVTTDFNGGIDVAYALVLQADGKLVAAGSARLAANSDFGLARYNSNGTLDMTFGTGGKITTDFGNFDYAGDVVIQPDGKIVAVGSTANGGGDLALARYLGDSVAARRTPFDFDGDGKADVSVFRPSDGTWYLLQSQAGFSVTQFGSPEDKPVAADYDGDGKTDIGVFRPSNGTWYLLRSQQGSTATQFGQAGDVPVPADYDNDGRADIAVFRPSNGTWYLLGSTAGFSAVQFGQQGDVPVAGDFDADGRADQVVFRPSNGTWYLQQSQAGYTAVQFGMNGDVPTTGDFDADGRHDIAVFRPSNGTWYRLNSSNNQVVAVQFGSAEDLPAPADFDGDGRTDIAVFRPSNGSWYFLQSQSGFSAVQFGTAGDRPAPSAQQP